MSLDRIAGGAAPERGAISDALTFLRDELPLHLRDEEEDLFPLMLRRCAPEDEIDRLIGRLESDHGHAAEDTPRVTELLAALEEGRATPDAVTRAALGAFATHARRHLTVENAIILPIARARLTPGDLAALREGMIARRSGERGTERAHAE